MELQITGKNMEISDRVRIYIESKLAKLARHSPAIMEARFEITEEKTKSPQQRYVAQLIVDASGMVLRAEERGGPMEARFEITEEKTKSPQQRYVAQLIVDASGMVLRAEERGESPMEAVDRVQEVMDRQISDFKGKRRGQKSRSPSATRGHLDVAPAGPARKVSKVKNSVVRHYTVSEAAEQLEALEYNFFLFYNTGSEKLNIIYRLEDGNYGLLDPDLTCVGQPGKK